VILTSGGHATTLPVEQSKLLVPQQAAAAPTFTFQTEIGGDPLTVSDIRTGKLEESSWTIVLSDHNFPEKYRRVIPRGTNPRSACVIVFESPGTETTLLGVSNCRKPTQKPKPKP
jgi:hypothetical protein